MSLKRVLISGSDQPLFSLLRILFQSKGCEVLELSDSKLALEVAKKEHPDLLLIDVVLPRNIGLELCRSFKKEPTTLHIKIVVLDTDRLQKEVWKNAGADLYHSKPFNSSELTTAVMRFLES